MKKDLTELVFIIDKSGSMYGMEKDTIGGFNTTIKEQKKVPGDCLVTMVQFNHQNELKLDRVKLDDVKPMVEHDYVPDGCTALLDAVGTTVTDIKKKQKEMDKEERPGQTILVIITDGYENSSKVYSYQDVKKLLSKQQEKHGWKVIFMGANIDVAAEADRLGVAKDCAMDYANDLNVCYHMTCARVREFRTSPKPRP